MASKAHKTSKYARGGGSELFLSDRPKYVCNSKRGETSKTDIENGEIPKISNRKVRERLIHLLAFKPYTKTELYTVLKREGLQECERRVIGIVLKDIAQLRQNAYSLRIRIWKEVDENWPYYTKEQQQQLKWHKEQNLRPLNSSDDVTSISSCSPTSTSNNSPPQLDENYPTREVDTFKRPWADSHESQTSKKRKTDNTIADKCTENQHTSSQQPTTHTYASTTNAELNKFDLSDYTEIRNRAQRHQYKAAFDQYFEEYMPLFQQIGELQRNFGELGGQFLQAPANSLDRQHITKRIVATYNNIYSQEGCRRQQRCNYLHAKLAHIKQLIMSYDSKCAEEAALTIAMECRWNATTTAAVTIARSDENPITNGYGRTETHIQIPATKNEGVSDFQGTDLPLSDSESDDD